MKSSILPLALSLLILGSCTTAYKSGQTPDDVYFSPVRPEEEYVKTEEKKQENTQSYEETDDSYLRMKVRNRYRWNTMDDPYYYRKSYSYNYYSCCYCSNSWTPYTYWNHYYNPYYRYNVSYPRPAVYSAPRKVNLASYNPQPGPANTKTYTSPRNYTGSTNNTYTAPRNNTRTKDESNSGNILRDLFNSGNKNNTSGSNSNSNNNSGSSSSSSSSSSNSGSSAPVRKF